MKKSTKKICSVLLLAGAMLMSFTSCLNSDDTPPFTAADAHMAFLAVQGTHTGKLIFQSTENGVNVNDTVAISWNIQSDSVMTINNFPFQSVAASVQDSDIRNAMLAAAPQNVKCNIGFYSKSPVAFLINPLMASFSATINGTTKQIQLAFYQNINQSMGLYDTSGRFAMQIVAAAVLVNGTEQQLFSQGVPLFFLKNK